MAKQKTSLKNLLLIHELAFILLILLVASAGAIELKLKEQTAQESNRINSLIQEMQQTRGDLYRQMKELFDAYFLDDQEARAEYNQFTVTVEQHFKVLEHIAVGDAEKTSIRNLHAGYQAFVSETSTLFDQSANISSHTLKKKLNNDLEAGIFKRYEALLANSEQLLTQKQQELNLQLQDNRRLSNILLFTPLALAALLLVFSRIFLKRSIVKPIEDVLKATSEISTGNLSHKVPEENVEELASLSKAINEMAGQLAKSQETLVRTEKQAAQGLLVPMLAHNIRNPLASIRATAQVMDDPHLDADSRDSLSGIISTVDRLERWTGALLAYLHPLKPQLTKVSIYEVIEGALAPLQSKIAERGIQLKQPAPHPHHLDVITTDQHLLEQVIYNLLLNAIDASPKNTTLEINIKLHPDTCEIQLSDAGSGMPFTPDPSAINAPTTKRFGTGLGIPFAFKVCDALGGSLQFTQRPTGGTTVTISLAKKVSNHP